MTPTRARDEDPALRLAAAVAALRADRPVAFPTETVWGLAVRADSDAAMAALRAWKGRASDQPVSVLISSPDVLGSLGIDLPPAARRLADAYWPGPLTLVVPCARRFAAGVARTDGAVGVRCSPHPGARALARATERAGLGPITATSLNRSGEPPARDLASARALCAGDDAPHLFDGLGEDASGARPSTVVDVTGAAARVLRAGAIDPDAVLACAGAPLTAGPTRPGDSPSDPPTPGDHDE